MTVEYSIAHRDPVTLIGYNGEGAVKYNVTGYKREFLEVKVRREASLVLFQAVTLGERGKQSLDI